MKTLNLALDLKDIKLDEKEKEMGPAVMSLRIIRNVINVYGNSQGPAKHYKGFNKHDRKTLYALMAKFKATEDSKDQTIQLEDDQAKFIQRCFSAEFMPNEIVAMVEKNVEEIKETKDA